MTHGVGVKSPREFVSATEIRKTKTSTGCILIPMSGVCGGRGKGDSIGTYRIILVLI